MQIMDVIERPVAKQSMAINTKGASTMNKATDYAKALNVKTVCGSVVALRLCEHYTSKIRR